MSKNALKGATFKVIKKFTIIKIRREKKLFMVKLN